jgi:hypothetical protein
LLKNKFILYALRSKKKKEGKTVQEQKFLLAPDYEKIL